MGGKERSNTQEFIKKAQLIHGDRYDYSLINYIDCKHKNKIICPIHGIFEQNANNHLQGQNCPNCKKDKISKALKCTQEEFLKKCYKIHKDKYNYSLSEYKGANIKIKIICKNHNYIFEQIPYCHINKKRGCPKCGNERTIGYTKSNSNEFIKKAKRIHGDKYNYSLVEYVNNHTLVLIICKKHPLNPFKQLPQKHLTGKGCPVCSSSKGENQIRLFLKNNNFYFEEQKNFEQCRLKNKLKFDFFIPDKNILIEFHGIQHYEEIAFFYNRPKYNFKYQQQRDYLKREFTKKNNIKFLEISYKQQNKIEQILQENLMK
jgi:hypothetical protein